jgi:hypothetical protein
MDIGHPAADTFAFIANFENNPIWQEGMDECQYSTAQRQGVGARYIQKAHFLGRELRSEFEVIQYNPPQLVKATTVSGSFPITFTRMVAGDEKWSHVHAIIEGEAKGFFRLTQPILKWMVKRSIEKDYKKLKQHLEGHRRGSKKLR